MKKDFIFGAKDGLPIALGYLAVSFSFGITASGQGVPVWVAIALFSYTTDQCSVQEEVKFLSL